MHSYQSIVDFLMLNDLHSAIKYFKTLIQRTEANCVVAEDDAGVYLKKVHDIVTGKYQ